MEFLAPFNPRLVGPVLRGTADEHAEVTLHVFADTPDEISLFLMEQGIPHQDEEKRVILAGGESAVYPAYRFIAEEVPMLPGDLPHQRHPPDLAQRGGWPHAQRAALSEVRALVENG